MVHVLYGSDETYQFGRYCNRFRLEGDIKVCENSKAYCVALDHLWFIDDSHKLQVVSLATFKDASEKWRINIDSINTSKRIQGTFESITEIQICAGNKYIWITGSNNKCLRIVLSKFIENCDSVNDFFTRKEIEI